MIVDIYSNELLNIHSKIGQNALVQNTKFEQAVQPMFGILENMVRKIELEEYKNCFL